MDAIDLEYEATPGFVRMNREACEAKGLHFNRYFFRHRDGGQFIVNRHHVVIEDTLDKVFSGEINRLIITIPPGYTKTEMLVIGFMSRGLAKNPRARFIHLSYSDNLAGTNSQATKDVVESPEYLRHWDRRIRADIGAKKQWSTKEGGGVYATAAAGQVTGFRAGRMEPGFTGAVVIDDPLKPDDAYSASLRGKTNSRINNTIKSRLAHEGVPIILIMQRLHEDDPVGFLLKGGTREKWHHLSIPALIKGGEKYPTSWSYGIPIEHGLAPGALWEDKHTVADLEQMAEADPYTYASQYDQRPSPLGGGMFKERWWRFYGEPPADITVKRMYIDTAQKKEEQHDFTVAQVWGFSPSMGILLLDQIRGKFEAPELLEVITSFWQKHAHNRQRHGSYIPVTACKIEDKSSGSSLIQTLSKESLIPVEAVQVQKDKVMRAMGVIPFIASGRVHIPTVTSESWVPEYLQEFASFTPLMTHAHDDQVDTTVMAIEDLLVKGNIYEGI
jgi:predicted phage terminase large subunit-like protein